MLINQNNVRLLFLLVRTVLPPPTVMLDRSFISSMSKETFKVYVGFELNTSIIALVSFDITLGTKLPKYNGSFVVILKENF